MHTRCVSGSHASLRPDPGQQLGPSASGGLSSGDERAVTPCDEGEGRIGERRQDGPSRCPRLGHSESTRRLRGWPAGQVT